MRILYLGLNGHASTSSHRIAALKRLGHELKVINPFEAYGSGPIGGRFHYRTGYVFAAPFVERYVLSQIGDETFDLVFVNHGENVGASLLEKLRKHAPRSVCYNVDDPFGKRDGIRWKTFLRTVNHYDLLVVVREENIEEALRRGVKRVHLEPQTFDPFVHRPLPMDADERERLSHDVIFVGTWMPERGPFMAALIERGVPLSIYGSDWDHDPLWSKIKGNYRGPHIHGADYTKRLQAAKICLCLMSEGNRDRYTKRSFEIPYIGSLLCAKRTPEHLAFYRDGEEAVFWSDADECARLCFELLADPARRERIAQAGQRKVKLLGRSNDEMLERVLKRVFEAT